MHFVYMILNQYKDLYVGISKDPTARLSHHNQNQGALYTKRNSKFTLVFTEEYADMASARKREIQIKKWRRAKKDKLIELYRRGIDTRAR